MYIILEDGFAIEKGTGIGQHTLNLFYQLRRYNGITGVQLFQKRLLSRVPLRMLRRILYIAWLNTWFQLYLRRHRPNVIHFTNYLVPVLNFSDAKYVVTVHDLAAWKFPEALPFAYGGYIKWAINCAVRKADLICTVTDAVKKELVEFFGIEGERVQTTYNAISERFWKSPRASDDKVAAIRKNFGIQGDFLLFVGTLEKRKNLVTLLKAFSEVTSKCPGLRLVLVGRPGYGFAEIENCLTEYRFRKEVIFTGYVTEDDKITLYDAAAAFVFPSVYEGFGIPLVEAMARGVPIVASRIPSTEEVAEGAALYYGDPFDHEALAECILKLLSDEELRRKLVEKGMARAQEFSWEKVAKRYLEAYKKSLKG